MNQFQTHLLKPLVIVFILIFISSCDDDVVGNWEPMKWKYENVSAGIKIIKASGNDHLKIEVSKSGCVDLICKNYNSFWFAEYPNMTNEGDYLSRFITDFCEMEIDDNILHCEFFNIEQYNQEEFMIVLTAGDIFYHFQIDIK